MRSNQRTCEQTSIPNKAWLRILHVLKNTAPLASCITYTQHGWLCYTWACVLVEYVSRNIPPVMSYTATLGCCITYTPHGCVTPDRACDCVSFLLYFPALGAAEWDSLPSLLQGGAVNIHGWLIDNQDNGFDFYPLMSAEFMYVRNKINYTAPPGIGYDKYLRYIAVCFQVPLKNYVKM